MSQATTAQPVSIVESIVVDENGKKKKIIRKVYAKKPAETAPTGRADPLSHSMIANATEEDIARIAQSLIDRLDGNSAPNTPSRQAQSRPQQPPRASGSRPTSRPTNRGNSTMGERPENSFMQSREASLIEEQSRSSPNNRTSVRSPSGIRPASQSAAGQSTRALSQPGLSHHESPQGISTNASIRSPQRSVLTPAHPPPSQPQQSMPPPSQHSQMQASSQVQHSTRSPAASTRDSSVYESVTREDESMRSTRGRARSGMQSQRSVSQRSVSRGGVSGPRTPRSRTQVSTLQGDESEVYTSVTANDQDMINRLRIQLMNERKISDKYKRDLDLLTNREEIEGMRFQINDLKRQLKEKDHELSLVKKTSANKERAFKQAFDADSNGQTTLDRLRSELLGSESLISGLRREKQALQEKNDEMERRERRLLKVLPTVYYRITGQQNAASEDPGTLIELVYNQFNSMAIDLRDSLLARDRLQQKVDTLTSELARCGKDLDVAVKSIENNRRRHDGELGKYKETVADLETRIMNFAKEYEGLLRQYKTGSQVGDTVIDALGDAGYALVGGAYERE